MSGLHEEGEVDPVRHDEEEDGGGQVGGEHLAPVRHEQPDLCEQRQEYHDRVEQRKERAHAHVAHLEQIELAQPHRLQRHPQEGRRPRPQRRRSLVEHTVRRHGRRERAAVV